MSAITTKLAEELSTVRRPGDFFTFGTAEILAPRLEVDGVGVISLPLLPVQAAELVAVAERAPYGRGTDTLIDTDVRRTWQISAGRVHIGGKHWAATLQAVLARVAEGLGVSEPIAAKLYKLLVYDQGSFFVSHRDTEKAPGMFATLVLLLPSVSTGGELVIRHKEREARLDLKSEEPSEAAFAAFYADCVHEVLPVTSGCRLALVFNLLRKGKGPKPEPPSYAAEQVRVTALLGAWVGATRGGDEEMPEKLIYPLEHAYTLAELGFDKLKGADAAVANVLVAAAPQAGCDLHLALVSIEESGIAEYGGGYGARRNRWSIDDEFEAGEVCDRDARLSEWRRPTGAPSALGALPVEEEELCPPDAFDDVDPDEEEFHEATGNEGASFERTYRRAALVLWPRDRFLAVLNQAGRSATLPYLRDLTERWVADGEDRNSAVWREAHELAGHMLSTWPAPEGWLDERKGLSEIAQTLALLTRLRDSEHIRAFLANVIASGRHAKRDNETALGAMHLFAPDETAALLERIVTANAANSLEACGDLLARAVVAFPHGKISLRDAARALVDALPGDPARAEPRAPWQERSPAMKSSFVVSLFTALESVDETLAGRAASHMLAWPKTYSLDAVLVPALRQLAGAEVIKHGAAVQLLRRVCLDHLRARVAEPLEAPKNWRRTSKLACRCADCSELASFLTDPVHQTWMFKAPGVARSHLEETIRKARCDLDVTTDRNGRPYSLVCTKNQASYDRRAKQRDQDLADLEQFEER
jgi:predicted 2-oxoglutarate/Fe(II)-dependent dioxygenase YbiX